MRTILLSLLLLSVSAHAQITIPAGTGDQMLSGMMGMMGKFSQQFQQSQGGALSGQMGSAQSANGQQGFGSQLQDWSSQAAAPQAMAKQMMAPMSSQIGQRGVLDGAWRSNNGEYLLIEGDRFRLHASRSRYIDGRLALRGNIAGFLYPQRETALLYRYRISGDQMALQGRDGRIMGYQRVRRR